MKAITYAAAIAALGLAGAAGAQSLEETYANLCSNETAAKSETCATLRKGLIAKLSSEEAPASPSPETTVHLATTKVAEPAPAACEAASPSPLGATSTGGAWEALTLAADTFWINDDFVSSGQHPILLAFTSSDGGRTMQIERFLNGMPWDRFVLRPTADADVLDAEYHDRSSSSSKNMKTQFRRTAEGVFTSDWFRVIEPSKYSKEVLKRYQIAMNLEGEVLVGEQNGSGANRPDFSFFLEYAPCTKDEFERVASQVAGAQEQWNRTVLPKLVAEAEAAERAKREAELARKRQSGDGGLFGSLVGAAVGAYAGAAAGLDTGGTIGAMMKGASITDPGNPMAGALASTGDQLLTGGGSSAIGGIGAASGGGSYPTKPNLATGACSGFTEGNYRTRALEGGGDSQLNTMCGQAFEYYTMYKRAIAQGYSEADANRTYAAHEQAARVANGYLSSHGAN